MTDRATDCLVAEEIMKWKRGSTWTAAYPRYAQLVENPYFHQACPFFTRDMSAVWPVVERLQAEGVMVNIENSQRGWTSLLTIVAGDVAYEGWAVAATAPRAICEAALRLTENRNALTEVAI